MEMMKQRVKTAPLLLEGPSNLSPRLGHIYHHCDMLEDKKKIDAILHRKSQFMLNNYEQDKRSRPSSITSSFSKRTEST
jgi:hypothetical protein